MTPLLFNAVTVALSTLLLPGTIYWLRGRRRLPSGINITVLAVNALALALLWIYLRSTFVHGEHWSYSGPLYIHWGIVIGSLVAWRLFSRDTKRG